MKDRQNHRKRKNVKVQFFQMRDIIFLLGLSCCLLQHLPYTNGFKGLMPFPEGEAPDGTRYKTAYRCEGETMSISCDSSETIQVIRANYGRFSIAICNKHGYTDWSVNCMSHTTTRILQRRCDSKRICDIEVNSGVFGDPCPNTYKYVEIHYACISIHSPNSGLSASTRRIPPWLLEGNAGDLWSSGGGSENSDSISLDGRKHSNHVVIKVPSNNDDNEHINHDPVLPPPRKPILVATDVIQHYDEIDNREKLRKDIPNERIPITTPKPTPSTTTVAVNTIDSDHQKTEEKPFGKGDESSVAKIASSEKENGKSNGDNESANHNAHISTNNGETYDKNENIGNKQLSREENKEKNNARDSDSNTNELSHKKDVDKLYSSQENQKMIEELMKHHCAPITSRYLNWNWTEAGDKSIQPCPSGSTGLARWTCEEPSVKGDGNPDWHGRQPDMSDCKSALMTDLESRIRKQDPENVLASKLALLTEPVNRVDDYDEKAAEKRLYGGDLEAAVAVMKSIANRLQYLMQTEQFYNKESYLQEIFQNIFRSGSNLLSRQHRDAWNDLSRNQRIKVASSLMNILEEHAFLLADVVQQPESIIESTKLAAMTLSVIDTQSKSFLSKNATIFPNLPQRRDGGGTVTRVGGNTETMSTSHFLKNPNNQNTEITQSRNRKARQKSGKTVNYKHNIFQRPQFKNKWLSNITDSIQLLNSIFDQQIFDSQYENGASASQFLQNSNKNDEFVGSVPAAKLINSQAEHDNNDDEVNAFIAQKQKLAKVIFFSFATLHEFLTDADQNLSQGSSTTLQNQREDTKYQTSQRKSKNLVLNSRIISASIDEKSLRRRTNQKYFYETGTNGNPSSSAHPPPFVRMQFKHIHEQMSDPICVYWNIDKESWSDSGCEVVSSNKKATTCQCNHLTHFALLMRFPDNMDIKSIGSGIIFDSGTSDDVFAKRENSSTVITLEIAIYIISTVCLLILILLVIQFRNRIRRVFRKIPCCGSTCCCSDSTRSNKKPKSNVVGSDSVIDKTRHQLYASTANINGGVTQIHHQISTNQAVNNGSNLQTVIHHNNNPQHIQHVIQNQTVQLMEQSLAPHSHSSSSGGSSSTTSSTGTSSGGSTGLDNSQQQLSTPNKPTMMLNTDTTQPPHPLSLNDNSNVGSINNVEQLTENSTVQQSPLKQTGMFIDLGVQEPLQDNKSISGRLLHRLTNLSYTSKKPNKKSSTKSWKEKKKDRITTSNSENFLHNPLDHLSTLPRTTLSTKPRLPVQQNHPFHQPQFRTTMLQQEHQMSPHTLRATYQIPSPMEDTQHTNIIVNPYSSSQALLMDRNNSCDMSNSYDYNSGKLQEYNYASVVNEMGDSSSTPFVKRDQLQSPSRLQQRHPTLISNPLNHHSIVSPQLARLTRTLRHTSNSNGIYGGSTSSMCTTASPNKTVLSSLSSTSCSPRSDMMRYQNTASIFSNSTEMSDLNGSSFIIYEDRNRDDTLPLGTTLYDSNFEDSSSNQHVYCEIPPVPPPPPAPGYKKSKPQMNFTEDEEENFFQQGGSPIQDRRDIFKNSKMPQLTQYEEEFIKQASSSSKLNASPVRRSCQSNIQSNSFSPTKSPRRFVSVENNATKFTNNRVIMDDSTARSPKKKNRLTGQHGNLRGKQFSDDNIETNHESQV